MRSAYWFLFACWAVQTVLFWLMRHESQQWRDMYYRERDRVRR